MNDNLLINKYKPQKLDDFYGQENTKQFIRNMININMGNFLLVSETGFGKTSYLETFVKEYFLSKNISNYKNLVLFINQSKEQGIHFFKNEIKLFCQTNSLHNVKKILAIDNLDTISESSQHIIRNFIDTYENNVFFISSATNQSKIISPLQSRLLIHYISKPKIEDFISLAHIIINNEKINIENNSLIKSISQKSNFSFRKLINLLDKFRLLGVNITSSIVSDLSGDISDSIFKNILDYLYLNNLKSAINCMLEISNLGYSNIDIYEGFYEFIKRAEIDECIKLELIPIICKFISLYYIHFEDPIDLILFVNKIHKIVMVRLNF